MEEEITPLPQRQMLVAFMVQMTEALNITVLFPYIAFMVEDFGPPYNTDENLGRYVGILAACFCGAQFFSSWAWAHASDRFGRKPTLFFGTLGVAFGMMIFGTATTYPQAIAGRITSGILCGNLSILKTFITEITDSSNRGGGFSILSISWSIGTVFSPLIGGMLSRPCVLYPGIFREGTWLGTTFTTFPYLLPALVVMCVNFVTCAFILLFLVETRPRHGDIEVTQYSPVLMESTHWEKEGLEMGSIAEEGQSFSTPDEEEDVKVGIKTEMNNLICRYEVQLAVGSYGLLALGQIVLDETLPLYMKLDRAQGGFSYETHDIGIILSVAGGVFMIFTLFVLPVVANYNKSSLYFYGCITTIPIALCMPLLPRINQDETVVWILLLTSLIWKNISLTLAFTAVCVQVTESASKDTELASVNALGQSIASLSRSIGPACGGLLWAIFLSSKHVEGNFCIVCGVMLMCIYLNRLIPCDAKNQVEGPRVTEGVESIWLSELQSTRPVLTIRDSLPLHEVDILILGAGMSGVSCAFHLAEMGKGCLCLEQRQISGGATGRNAGMLWPKGQDEFELKTSEKLMKWVCENMDVETEALVSKGGGVRLVKKGTQAKGRQIEDIASLLPGLGDEEKFECYYDPTSTSLFPGRIVHALAEAASRGGAEFMEYVTVHTITKRGSLQRVHTSHGFVDAKQVVVATNALIPMLLPELRPYLKPVTNSVIASATIRNEAILPKVSGISSGGGSSEIYMNVRRDGKLILGGMRNIVESEETSMWSSSSGQDTGGIHDAGEGDPRIVAALKDWLQKTFPELATVAEFTHSWKGLIAITKDGMPIVGPLSPQFEGREGVYVCGGFGGHGMPRCYGFGESVARMLLGKDDPSKYSRDYIRLCNVNRFHWSTKLDDAELGYKP